MKKYSKVDETTLQYDFRLRINAGAAPQAPKFLVVFLYVCLYGYLYLCLSVHLSVRLSVHLSVHPSVGLSPCVSVSILEQSQWQLLRSRQLVVRNSLGSCTCQATVRPLSEIRQVHIHKNCAFSGVFLQRQKQIVKKFITESQ